MQAVDHHGPQFHQLVPVSQLPQHFPTFLRVAKQRRKLTVHQQLQDQVGIAPIVLLPPPRQSSDLRRIAHQQFVAQALNQLLEPVRVATSFDPDDHFPLKLTVVPLDVITLMTQLYYARGPITGVQVTESLLSRVNVYSDI